MCHGSLTAKRERSLRHTRRSSTPPLSSVPSVGVKEPMLGGDCCGNRTERENAVEVTDWASVGIAAAAALAGAVVGGRYTLRAAREAFERQGERESLSWRRGLMHECVFNMHMLMDEPRGTWHLDTRVLDEMFLHADDLTTDQLDMIRAVRQMNFAVERQLTVLQSPPETPPQGWSGQRRDVLEYTRDQILREVMMLEQSVRHRARDVTRSLRTRLLGWRMRERWDDP